MWLKVIYFSILGVGLTSSLLRDANGSFGLIVTKFYGDIKLV